MPSSAKNVLAQKMEDATNCEPATAATRNPAAAKATQANPTPANTSRTDLGLDMPPVTSKASTHKRYSDQPYTQNMGPKKRKRKVALGAAILGGIAAGAYALYKSNGSAGSSAGQPQKSAGNTLAALLPKGQAVTIRKRQEVKAKSSVVYAEWRKLENLPNILSHLKEVEVLSETRSKWTAKGPAGTEVNWFANITEDEPGRALAWRAEDKADVPNSGRILFSETPKGNTLIEVTLTYQPPAGSIGQAVAAAFGENPEQQITDDLKNFAQTVESRVSA